MLWIPEKQLLTLVNSLLADQIPNMMNTFIFPKQTGVNNLDFEFYRAASTTFGSFSTPMSNFANMLVYTQEDYDHPNQTVTFLDNHDVTRFGYTQRSQKVYNAALAVLLTSRGIPTIYYGTEQYVIPGDASDVAGRVYMPTECGFSTTTTAYQLIATPIYPAALKRCNCIRHYNRSL